MKARKPIETDVSEDELFEMSNLTPGETGLANRIWISVNVNQRHHLRHLKVEGPVDGISALAERRTRLRCDGPLLTEQGILRYADHDTLTASVKGFASPRRDEFYMDK